MKLKKIIQKIAILGIAVVFFTGALAPMSGYGAVAFATEHELLWEKRYDGGSTDIAHDVAVDKNNNIIVTGESSSDYYTIKYDPFGNQLWGIRYNSGFNDKAFAVATDSKNNVIVTGAGGLRNGHPSYYTIKYDSNGNQLWADNVGTGESANAYDVTVDSNDNIIVTGHFLNYSAEQGNHFDFLTLKYDPNGRKLWYKIYNKGEDMAFGVAIDSKDNVIVTGVSNGDFLTIKYDANGNELWGRTLDNGSSDTGFSVAVDNLDNIIVVGSSYNSVNKTYYTFLIKYDSSGMELWKRNYEDASWNKTLSVAVDSLNNIIVTGPRRNNNNNYDYYIVAYSPSGNVLWEEIYDGGLIDMASGVAVDSMDNVIVTGSSRDTQFGNSDYLTLKYGEPVVSIPTASFTASPASGDAPLAVRFTDTSTNNPTSWSWDFDNNGIINSNQQNPSHIYSVGTYSVSLTATNTAGSNTKTIPNYITATQPNRDPVLTLNPAGNQTINENQSLTINVSATDLDKDLLTFTITNKPSGAVFTDNNNNTATFSWTPDYTQSSGSPYSVTFNVTDGKIAVPVSQTIAITVNNVICNNNGICEAGENNANCPNDCPVIVDNPPTANAGSDQIVYSGDRVDLDGRKSSDSEGDDLSYQWTQIPETTVNLQNSNSATPFFIAPIIAMSSKNNGHYLYASLASSIQIILEFFQSIFAEETAPSLTFQLIVTANNKLSPPDTVLITIKPQPLPCSLGTIRACVDFISPNPANKGQTITFTGHGESDVNQDKITKYQWKIKYNNTGGTRNLSSQSSFSTNAIPQGTHTVYFRAGTIRKYIPLFGTRWSEWVTRGVVVR